MNKGSPASEAKPAQARPNARAARGLPSVAIIVTAEAPDATRVTCDVPRAMTTRTLAACIDVSDYARQ